MPSWLSSNYSYTNTLLIVPYNLRSLTKCNHFTAEKPSVCPTVMPISQPCQHGLKRDLLEMKAESSGITKYVFTSLSVPVFIHTSVQKALM